MKTVVADLHVHTALSPCADDGMTPRAIVLAAIAAEIDLIAVCDHNSAENTAAVCAAARDFAGDLFGVLAGMEITTAEEAHILGLFPDAERAMAASCEVADHLPAGMGASAYGNQYVMDAAGQVVRTVDKMLSWASDLTLNQAVALIHQHGGLAIAAHVDRPSFSVTSQLGFLPEDVIFDAIELSAAGAKEGRAADFDALGYPLIAASDAHFPDNIGDARTVFQLEAPVFSEVARALKKEGERSYCLA